MNYEDLYPFRQTILYSESQNLRYKVPVIFDVDMSFERVTTVWIQLEVAIENRLYWMFPGQFRVTCITHKNNLNETIYYRTMGWLVSNRISKTRFMNQAYDQINKQINNHFYDTFTDKVALRTDLIEL